MGELPEAARAALHYYEEPVISGHRGSGTVFFSGCNLRCCYCQNAPISLGGKGQELSIERLAEIYLELETQGAHNINLVNPTHFTAAVIKSIEAIKGQITIPFVWNSSGYESVDVLKTLEGLIDIYLPDLKYVSPVVAKLYSGAEDYFHYASQAVLEMYRQVGGVRLNAGGIIEKGLIIRHLVLPNSTHDSVKVLEWIKSHLPEDVYVSLMGQYTPPLDRPVPKSLNRRLTHREYQLVVQKLHDLGIKKGFIQGLDSACSDYTPDFNFEGI